MTEKELIDRFNLLSDQWQKETKGCSSMSKIVGHPAYREIISMGNPVIPLMLKDFQATPRFWFSALREIAGESPVPIEDAGKVQKMIDHWILWGQENGYI